MARRAAMVCLLALVAAASARGQTGSSGTSTGQSPTTSQTQSSSTATAEQTRPATTTFFGDTGLWFVPTAEVLPRGRWSVSGYRRGTNWVQGYTNVGDFDGTFGVGVGDRAEIFGAFLFDTRIDRDTYPLFINDSSLGGVIDRYPRVNQHWTGDNLGDFYAGAKLNLWSEYRLNPAAIALRGMVKLPTADKDAGNGTGKADVSVDLIASKELARTVEWAGFGGYEFRGKPDGFDTAQGAFRWGTGIGFPSRNIVRVTGELNGYMPSGDSATITGSRIVGTDGTISPLLSDTENITRATVGLTVQSKKGFFFGAGASWNVPSKARDTRFTDTGDLLGDYYDWQFRIGYHPGVRVWVPPRPPEATRVLDEAVTAMRENATLRVEIEGHTCSIGTAEYNLALGDRRANAVKDYLVSRGVTADRLRTVSYGEERPKYDNSREETRRLNRRAALVVNLR